MRDEHPNYYDEIEVYDPEEPEDEQEPAEQDIMDAEDRYFG